jgi:3-methyladenine DNA glycosylase AlkD
METDAKHLYEELNQYCRDHADEAIVKKYSRYFKGGYNAYGLTQALMDAKKEDLKKRQILNFDLIFNVAPMLISSGKYEETSFILSMLSTLTEKFDISVFQRIEVLYETGINNWAHADYLGMFMLPIFLKKKIVTKEDFIPWVTSEFKFKRRCVPVTFIKLIKEEKPEALFSIIKPLMHDTEREVHQGVGWFLRESWKVNREPTEQFLLEYKETAPRLIFQYACEKMTAQEKLRFKKSKG